MKRLFFLSLFCIVPVFLSAQWSVVNTLTFDSGDTLFPHLVSIDTVHYHHNIWQIGKPNKRVFTSALSLPNAIVTDTLNPYPINDTSVFVLKMPFIVPIPGWGYAPTADMRFSYQLRKDSNSIARFEVSQDNGGHWYNAKDTLPSDFLWPGGDVPNLSDTTSGWTTLDIGVATPYSASLSDTFLFRFTFISDSSFANKDGWIIDDIYLNYYVESVSQIQNHNVSSIYPNPTSQSLTITSSDQITNVAISNLLGQTVYSQAYDVQKAEVNVAGLPAGVYVVRVSDGQGNVAVRKVLKE